MVESKVIDLVGRRFGKLVVISYAGMVTPDKPCKQHLWWCKCDCGTNKKIRGAGLCNKVKPIKSCGCSRKESLKKRFIDYTGKQFGKLKVLSYSHSKDHSYWLCRCECGTEKVISIQNIKRGLTTSCGCYNKIAMKTHGLSSNIKEYRKYLRKNPLLRLREAVSGAVRDELSGRRMVKDSKTFDKLPYTIEQLKAHLEAQFADWMSWDNYGGLASDSRKTWWIDHIVPQSS